MRFLIPLLCFFLCVNGQWSMQKSWQSVDEEPIDRQPLRVDVRRYDLRLEPFFSFPGFSFHPSKKMTFEGRLNVTFGLFEAAHSFRINSAGLQIKQADVWAGDRRLNTGVSVERLLPLANIRTQEELEANRTYVLRLHFGGRIDQREARGLFSNNYADERGTQRTMIATLLEPKYARRLFPCFDAIELRAVFQLTLVHPRNASVFHNTLPKSEEDFGGQLKITTFKPTIPMATYHFALAIGEFAIAETSSRSGIKVRSISLPHSGENLRKAAKIAAKSIDFYEKLLDVKFPLEKLDMLESSNIPVGAVENVGLSLFRGLLSIPPTVSSQLKITQMLLIAHEVAHVWFGGMVTASTWNQMFLHESFAQFLSYKAAIQLVVKDDRWLIEAMFVNERIGGLRAMDTFGRPIVDQRAVHFDDLTYKAGAAVVGQLEAVLGEKVFFLALKTFLLQNQFGNANIDDLIFAFEAATRNQSLCPGISIRSFIEDSLLRSAYPLVNVRLHPHMFTFEQTASDGSDRRWNVPLFLQEINRTESEGEEMLVWLKKDGSLCTKGGKWRPNPNGTFVFNGKGRSFARFSFDKEVRSRLLYTIHLIDPPSQYALINDFIDERRRNPSLPDYARMFIERIVEQTGDLPPLLAKLLPSVYKEVGVKSITEKLCPAIDWDPQSLTEGIKTHSLILLAAQFGLCDVQKRADEMFGDFVLKCFRSADILECNKMNGDVRQAVYCNAVKRRNETTLLNYANWMNGTTNRMLFEYDELPNVRRAMRCR